MRARQVVVATMIVLVAAVLIAAPALGSAIVGSGDHQTDDTTADSNESAGAFGQQIASFAQTTAVDADESADQGMWRAAANESENPERVVAERTDRLERRVQVLQNQTERLQAQRDAGVISETAYTGRASALRSRIANLRETIEDTETVARQRGVESEQLNEIRSKAAGISGPDVDDQTREITDASPGPPDDAG
ncbi:hypothetical protein BRD09_03490, partial [Halobacteriales archaeon SW_10_68_16]